MKTAVVYARYSSEKQTEQSIEGQLRVCQEFAAKNDIKIVDTYIDRATTGTNDNRAAFQKMLSDSEKNPIWDIVLVYALDRFGRNTMFIPDDTDHFVFTVRVAVSPMFLSWLMGFGSKAKILHPQSVIDQYTTLCKEALSQY